MGRRRLYVFGAIILLGVLIGFFCLPESGNDEGETAGPNETGGSGAVRVERGERGSLPPADISNSPTKQAEALVKKALTLTDATEKGSTLLKAYHADPEGRWGGEAAALIGDMWKAAGDSDKARQWYVAARKAPVSPATLKRVNDEVQAVTRKAVPTVKVKMLRYKVQPNDSLWKIARRYATTIGALKKANNLRSDLIRVGITLKVPKGPFDVRVSKAAHTLTLLQEDRPVKVYEVGLGKADSPTPTGTYTVQNKLVNPVWYSDNGPIAPGDPRNVLGSRWIGFNGRLGIHGCRKSDEDTIGQNVSNGCVRMRTTDVEDLYNYLVAGKSKVIITD
jgi:lipoprotein-anchoring transpeptidase ErfK/SrfK